MAKKLIKKSTDSKKTKKAYEDLIEPKELEIAEGVKLVFSVSKRSDTGNAHVDIRTWVDKEGYSGPTKKGINFDVEWLYDFIEVIDEVNSECEDKQL